MAKLRALPLVMPTEELRGVAPPAFERAAARARVGDDVHGGLIRVCSAVALNALSSCTPPGARSVGLAALELIDSWARGSAGESAVKRGRADLFAALAAIERSTAEAVRASLDAPGARGGPSTAIDTHADEVVVRYAALGAHYAASTAVLTFDAISVPRDAALVLAQAAGALAYRTVGLGPARTSELRTRALEQAEWEHARPGAPRDHGVQALSVQLFHEYLGALWKDQSDAQRAYLFDFAEWALPVELCAS